jgi:hypothetical protein
MPNTESRGTNLCKARFEETFQVPVVRLDGSKIEIVATILSQALENDAHIKYLLPENETRRMVLPRFFSFIANASYLWGESYTTENMEGAALWISPGRAFTLERIVRTDIFAARFKLGWATFRRCVNLAAQVETVHKQLAVGPHWYLMVLGVKPSTLETATRGALLQPVLSRADSEGLPCYLETFVERDIPFYEDRGFRLQGAGSIPRGGPNFWAMRRPPH